MDLACTAGREACMVAGPFCWTKSVAASPRQTCPFSVAASAILATSLTIATGSGNTSGHQQGHSRSERRLRSFSPPVFGCRTLCPPLHCWSHHQSTETLLDSCRSGHLHHSVPSCRYRRWKKKEKNANGSCGQSTLACDSKKTTSGGIVRYAGLKTRSAVGDTISLESDKILASQSLSMEDITVGFVGAGQMAEALARGFHGAGLVQFKNMVVSDVAQTRLDLFKSLGVNTLTDGAEVAATSDVLFIAVKPHVVKTVLTGLKNSKGNIPLIVSIAAGIPLSDLEEWVGEDVRVIRVMPNTPCLVGEMAAAMSLGKHASKADADLVKNMMESVGKIYTVEENLLDAVTGLSGSGPAYVFVMIEALADGGVMAGLPRDIALALAAQTVLGSAKMVLETGKHPGQLKDAVASPGGTTIAALHEMEKGAFRGTVMNAVLASAKRSKEMSQSK